MTLPGLINHDSKEQLTMAKNAKETGSKAATAASNVLRNPRSTKPAKTAAASALAQKARGKK